MFDVITDALSFLFEYVSENSAVGWLLILVFVILIIVSAFITYKLTIVFNKIMMTRAKPLKEKIEELVEQLDLCRDKVQELHNKNAELLIKFYNEDDENNDSTL